MQIISKQGQWLGDIAVRESGSIEAIIEMAIVNNIAITKPLMAGFSLLQPKPINNRIINYYKINNIYPATSTEINESTFNEGIGYMIIEQTFIVA